MFANATTGLVCTLCMSSTTVVARGITTYVAPNGRVARMRARASNMRLARSRNALSPITHTAGPCSNGDCNV
jgi:hypothetical protein